MQYVVKKISTILENDKKFDIMYIVDKNKTVIELDNSESDSTSTSDTVILSNSDTESVTESKTNTDTISDMESDTSMDMDILCGMWATSSRPKIDRLPMTTYSV